MKCDVCPLHDSTKFRALTQEMEFESVTLAVVSKFDTKQADGDACEQHELKVYPPTGWHDAQTELAQSGPILLLVSRSVC